MSSETEVESQVEVLTRRLDGTRRVARQVGGYVLGLGIFGGATYLGLKTGQSLADTTSESSIIEDAMRYATIALPTGVYGIIGASLGFYTTVAIAGGENAGLGPSQQKQETTQAQPPTPTHQ